MKKLIILGGALAAALLLAGAALAASTLTVRATFSKPLNESVVVNPAGRTLYSLSGESSHRLLCKSSECTGLWPPLLVKSRTTHLKLASGAHGTLGLIKRPNGSLQVTLRGKPLYRYAGDTGPAQGHGEGIRAFGGIWHAVTASAAQATPPPMAPPSEPPGY